VSTAGADWVEQARRFAAGLAGEHAGLTDVLGGLLGPTPAEQPAGGGSECRSCPLCAGLAALRERRPDLLEALADLLAGAATALRTTARTTPDGTEAGTGAPEPTAPPEETVPDQAPVPSVQRIEVA
jgi:hypothetical protein